MVHAGLAVSLAARDLTDVSELPCDSPKASQKPGYLRLKPAAYEPKILSTKPLDLFPSQGREQSATSTE